MKEKDRLDRNLVIHLLDELNDEARKANIKASIYVVGGAAIAASNDHINVNRVTEDVDVLLECDANMREEVEEKFQQCVEKVADKYGLSRKWLNSDCKNTTPDLKHKIDPTRNLSITFATAEELLAMKVLAQRRKDENDIIDLINTLDVHSEDEIKGVVAGIYGSKLKQRLYDIGADTKERFAFMAQNALRKARPYRPYDDDEITLEKIKASDNKKHMSKSGKLVPCNAKKRKCPRDFDGLD